MKLSRKQVRRKAHALPTLRFEDQQLTSFSGLLLFQVLFSRLKLKERLRKCFENGNAIYARAQLMLGLIVHLLLGYRELREARYYRDALLSKNAGDREGEARGWGVLDGSGGRFGLRSITAAVQYRQG
ncbi:MAG: hypothetical protein L0191_06615 [Acidobacteria bacterium]|nr:hypothetical protein [Acidobacteriota bacterium]